MKFLLSALLLSFIFVACGGDKPDPQETKDVQNAFAGYKQGVIAARGSEALQWVDSTTIAYYNRLIALATTADSATVRALELQDRFMVQSIRHTIPKEEVLRMDGAGLCIYTIEHSIIGEGNMEDLEIGNVEIKGDSARGMVLVKGKVSRQHFRFNRENDRWKIDLTSLFGSANATFKKMLTESGKSEDEFIADMLTYQTEKKPGPEIWQPMK